MKVILSIKPRFVGEIFEGTKKYEYRKQIFKKNVDSILIYSTKPTGKVVGEIYFNNILEGTPSDIWNLTASDSGMDKKEFDKYFEGKKNAYAISINKVVKYDILKDIRLYTKSGRPPQSYYYFDNGAKEGL